MKGKRNNSFAFCSFGRELCLLAVYHLPYVLNNPLLNASILFVISSLSSNFFEVDGGNPLTANLRFCNYSAVSLTKGELYDWFELLNDGVWLHTTGITPALSETSAHVKEVAIRTAKEKGLIVSCNLIFERNCKAVSKCEEGSYYIARKLFGNAQ